jgi:hypothetical protein
MSWKRLIGISSAITASLCLGLGSDAAVAAEFHVESAPATVQGVNLGTPTVTTTGGEVTCESGSYVGTLATKTSTSLTVTPTWTGCHLILFGSTVSLTAKMNGCTFTFYATGKADIKCPAGKNLELVAAGCTIHIGGQTGKSVVSYSNNSSHMVVAFALSGISYTHTGFTCGTGSGTTGTLAGGFTGGVSGSKIWFE